MLLFNRPIKVLMLRMSRISISYDYDECIKRQSKTVKYNDAFKESIIIPIVSTVVFKQEDGGIWTHGTITDKGYADHDDRFYKTE